MPAVVPFINSSNAQALAKLSWEHRRAKASLSITQQDADPAKLACIREQLQIVQEQIAATRAELNEHKPYCPACERGPMEPHHRAQLLKALDTLLDRQRVLNGIPTPGQLRPTSPRAGRDAQRPPALPIGYGEPPSTAGPASNPPPGAA